MSERGFDAITDRRGRRTDRPAPIAEASTAQAIAVLGYHLALCAVLLIGLVILAVIGAVGQRVREVCRRVVSS